MSGERAASQMIEDATVSAEEVKQIAQKVLVIERVTLRRAWGAAYGVAAAELKFREGLN